MSVFGVQREFLDVNTPKMSISASAAYSGRRSFPAKIMLVQKTQKMREKHQLLQTKSIHSSLKFGQVLSVLIFTHLPKCRFPACTLV